jgi:Flp pilus assembly protein TadG
MNALLITGGAASSGADLTITVPGTLAIRNNAGQLPAFYPGVEQWAGFTITVGTAPTGLGSQISVDVYLATSPPTLQFTLAIAAGTVSVSATAAQIAAAVGVPANTNVYLNITAVGSTFPGADLTAKAF